MAQHSMAQHKHCERAPKTPKTAALLLPCSCEHLNPCHSCIPYTITNPSKPYTVTNSSLNPNPILLLFLQTRYRPSKSRNQPSPSLGNQALGVQGYPYQPSCKFPKPGLAWFLALEGCYPAFYKGIHTCFMSCSFGSTLPPFTSTSCVGTAWGRQQAQDDR